MTGVATPGFHGRVNPFGALELRPFQIWRPPQVEQTLRAMPGVAEAAVFPYLRFGESAIAAVISPEPETALDETTARAFLAERLVSYKLPRTILVLATLPRGSHDKIDCQALRALFADEVVRR